MSTLNDLTGQKFGKWTVIDRGENQGTSVRWNTVCDCGRPGLVKSSKLVSGQSKQCKCCAGGKNGTKHGLSRSPEYKVLENMKNRCFNPKYSQFHRYGGRGITLCERWMGSDGIQNFVSDMGRRPNKGWTIERVDNDGNYCPENCVWVPPGPTQSRNQEQVILNLELANEIRQRYSCGEVTQSELAKEYGYKSAASISDIIHNKIWI